MYNIEELTLKARNDHASDIHLVYGLPPKYRVDGRLESMADVPLTEDDCIELCQWLAEEQFDKLDYKGELDFSKNICGIRCRCHIFKQQGKLSAAIRLLSETIPRLDSLGLPPSVPGFTKLHKGIVLVTGETGSGKSTTLAALLNEINHTRKDHIVTLEDPIEYIYKPDQCIINQREIGKDTESFSEGLRASLREDPDVILIGEMRDHDTIETAITAAETGHLVFGTLHTDCASDAIDRMVQVFPEGMQNQIRLQLSMTLIAVIAQQLLRKKTGGRVLASEVMLVTDAIRNMIRSGNTPQIANAISTSSAIGGQTMDQCLAMLSRSRQIDKDLAMEYAKDKDFIRKNG